jgi:hypothetical protein
LPPLQLQSVWASFWPWQADVARVLCALREPGDHPVAEQHDGCANLIAKAFTGCRLLPAQGNRASISAVEILKSH